ncbi:MAG TPA: type II toxin-antitoxin system Phd/YefM family antitoxin [Thermoanaerobaculia bacterium]|jgi:PHD/YefM family antitoxin component YafN of YafNO toxin-antitoxin module|nr:type II toxin-antitoxin system Phd/YefM family antitoxin [Thermoanaerobaculia bacterium]
MDLVYRRIDGVLTDLGKLVSGNRRVILLASDDEPKAVLLGIDDYRSMQATISLANDPAMLQHVMESAEQMIDAMSEEPVLVSGSQAKSEEPAHASVSPD